MEFAMVHADAAEEVRCTLAKHSGNSANDGLMFQVCDIICQSLVLEATPVPRKLARLHLISDILHNSVSSPGNAFSRLLTQSPCLGVPSSERLEISTRIGDETPGRHGTPGRSAS
jgi:hypothetical protein